MVLNRAILLLLLVFFFANTTDAQQQIFKWYGSNDGMVANHVRRIFQDSKGFLWIATWEGLSKYDGHKFTNFITANGLSHNLINDVYESANGNLYVACNNGAVDVIAETRILQKALTKNVIINCYRATENGKIIAGTDQNGLFEFDNGKLIKPTQAFPNANYYDICSLNDSLLIAGSEYALHILDKEYRLFAEQHNSSPVYSECIIYKDSKNRVWIGSYHGLSLLAASQNRDQPICFAPLPEAFNIPIIKESSITEILEDRSGNMWFGTTNGLVKIESGGAYQVYNEKNGLPSDLITSIYQDKEMNIWIGTSGGLAKLVTKNSIRNFSTESGLVSNKTGFIAPLENGNLLISNEKGLQVYDKKTDRFESSIIGGEYYGFVNNSDPLLLFSSHNWAAFDPETKKITIQNDLPIPPRNIYYAVKDANQNILAGTDSGLCLISRDGFHFSNFVKTRILALQPEENDLLWMGTWNNGLYRISYKIQRNKLEVLSSEQFLHGKNIRSLFRDSNGNIWVGTRFDGVYIISREENSNFKIRSYSQANGLTSNWVTGIREDKNKNIWISYYQGLDKLVADDTAYRVLHFSRVNNYYPSINGIVADKEHSLWVSTSQGIANIVDGQMENLPSQPVYISSVSLSTASGYITASANESLPHWQNQLQFEFTSPSFINEKQVLYSYRLNGSNSDNWSLPSNQHTVSYAKLEPGTYRFEVRALGWNGQWGKAETFPFTIRPPFWASWWFICLACIMIAAIIYWGLRKRVRMVRREAEMKNKITETEIAALRAQMNPHFVFNCLNGIDNLIQDNEKDKATSYLVRFAKLIRSILENSKLEVIPVWKDLETLKLYLELEKFRCDNRFNYTLDISEELLRGDFRIPPMIIQPFVENAIHHGLMHKKNEDRNLLISGEVLQGTIKFTVEDNGIGRKKAADFKEVNKPAHASLGLNITRRRIDLHNDNMNQNTVIITDLVDKANAASGTRVEVILQNR